MPESLYKPAADLSTSAPMSPNTVNDSEGKASTIGPAPQEPAEVILKRVLAGVVVVAGSLVTVLPEHTIGYRVCFAIVGLGAALGITSRGVQPKQ